MKLAYFFFLVFIHISIVKSIHKEEKKMEFQDDYICSQYVTICKLNSTSCIDQLDEHSEEWIPLTRSMIKRLGWEVWKRLEEQDHTGRTLASLFWAEMGAVFEEAVLQSLGLNSNVEDFNGTVPDAVGRIINGKIWQGWPKAVFIEVKISTLIPTRDRDRLQILKMIEYLRQVTERADVTPVLLLVTPAGGFIKEEIVQIANEAKISLLHAEVEANTANNRVIRVGPAVSLSSEVDGVPLWAILNGKASRPAGLNL